MLKTSIQLHKWIGLVVGLQVLFWVLGGLIMTAIPIERVHGDHHLAHPRAPAIATDKVVPVAKVAEMSGLEVSQAELRNTPKGPAWIVQAPSGQEIWFDALTGGEVQEMTQAEARAAAIANYEGKAQPESVKLLDVAPVEAGGEGPLWQVRFKDGEGTTLYLDPYTGDVTSRRSDLWRFYDFFYRLHIMNFGPAETYNHPLIVAASALALAIVLTGVVLLWFRLGRDLKGWLARRRAARA
jgi:uncharacterized iron-regulated membrane protein